MTISLKNEGDIIGTENCSVKQFCIEGVNGYVETWRNLEGAGGDADGVIGKILLSAKWAPYVAPVVVKVESEVVLPEVEAGPVLFNPKEAAMTLNTIRA